MAWRPNETRSRCFGLSFVADRGSRLVGSALDGGRPRCRGCPYGPPTPVPDRIITDLWARERNGLVVLPAKPGLRRGDQVRITRGPMAEHLAIYEGMKGRERVEVLLAILGSEQRVELSRRDVEPVVPR